MFFLSLPSLYPNISPISFYGHRLPSTSLDLQSIKGFWLLFFSLHLISDLLRSNIDVPSNPVGHWSLFRVPFNLPTNWISILLPQPTITFFLSCSPVFLDNRANRRGIGFHIGGLSSSFVVMFLHLDEVVDAS